MPSRLNQSFDATTVKLENANLIEASAGTGKTYSIALMALRLLIEQKITIDQILMVTFTNDAAAEMELRLRDFVRDALTVARSGGGIKDQTIIDLVNNAPDKTEVIKALQNALIQFDQAAVYTIHGFCARVLKEFAFECGQIFQSATLEPDHFEQYFEEAFNQAWRDKFTILSEEQIRLLFQKNKIRSTLHALVKGHLTGKLIYIPPGMQSDFNQAIQLFDQLNADEALLRQEVENRMDSWCGMRDRLNKEVGKKHLLPLLDSRNVEAVVDKIKASFTAKYIKEFFEADVLAIAERLEENEKQLKSEVALIFNSIAIECAEYIQARLINQLGIEGRITFDDMITHLHNAVCKNRQGGNPLIDILRSRYRAVFIDEFQDTDQLQYEIFSKLFNEKNISKRHTLFYIGDPKQSIYAFRKADLYTYFRAENEVDNVYRMNINYRSTDAYIEAMNIFFQAKSEFDVFISTQMQYHAVAAPPQNKKQGRIQHIDRLLEPMRIIGCEKKPNIYDQVVILLKNLLYDKAFSFSDGQTKRPIEAAQIGILVRSNKDGSLLRKIIAKEGIPVITVGDEKIFKSSVARDVYYILDAAQNISKANIRRALLTTIAGVSWSEVLLLDEERLFEQFRRYQDLWKSKGIYVFLRCFLQDVQAIQRKLDGTMANADRVLSDYFQLMEMLHEEETEKKLIPAELISQLRKSIEGELKQGDQYLQRIESDEKAVKIVTIHRSKGLEYDIVIAPFLDIQLNPNPETYQLYDSNQYYTADADLLFDEAQKNAITQLKQENMRLLYVAITRARYHCYIMSAKSANDDSSLNRLFLEFLKENEPTDHIKLIAAQKMGDSFMSNVNLESYAPELIDIGKISPQTASAQSQAGQTIKIPENRIPDLYWQKTSYSGLNIKREPVYKQKTEVGQDLYDQFVFKEIRSGAQAGNFLHEILERIDFSDETAWHKKIRSALNRYPGIIKTEIPENKIIELMRHVMGVDLKDGEKIFQLNQVKMDTRINELEFDLPLTDIHFSSLPETIDDGKIPLRMKHYDGLTGILNGKIDLFFEHEGRYYIIDWKSNHLGNQREVYHLEAMAMEMEEKNYYLQYYLYSLAMYRYLKLRLKDTFNYDQHFGGVYYLFLRGIRKGQPYGIYSHRPTQQDLVMLEDIMLMKV